MNLDLITAVFNKFPKLSWATLFAGFASVGFGKILIGAVLILSPFLIGLLMGVVDWFLKEKTESRHHKESKEVLKMNQDHEYRLKLLEKKSSQP
ncbi:hypothetical protein JZO79_12065 [Vagococcus fluvialis]|uniref:hypothetical protein n=1 Tax=Vagococcus fluvialis TaxID=2738 RepID=UPI001A8C9320|nr:hypothetical protein [Vagococcus fluvialis]MBO0444350.1 hypothetical protein [Vagococcus fluvialis]